MRKMILGIMVLTCTLPTFSMDEEKQEYVGQLQQQQSLKLGDNSQQTSWWVLPKIVSGALELTHSSLRRPEGKEDTLGSEGEMMRDGRDSSIEKKKNKPFFVQGEVTLEKIPENGLEKGKIYLEKIEKDQLKCTGFITFCENGVENTLPISAPIPLFVPGALTSDLGLVQPNNPNQIQDLFEYAVEQLTTDDQLGKYVYQGKVPSETPSEELTKTKWRWSTGAPLLTPLPAEDVREGEQEQRKNPPAVSLSAEGGNSGNWGWGSGSLSELLTRSSEEKREPGETPTTTSSLPNFSVVSMFPPKITFATPASNTDSLAKAPPKEGMWGYVEQTQTFLGGYLNLEGYLGGKKEEASVALEERDQKEESEDWREEELKKWRVIGQEEKEEKYKTFLMSDLPLNQVPGDGQIYVKKLHDKVMVKFSNFGEPMLAFPLDGKLEEGKRYVGENKRVNRPRFTTTPSGQQLVTVVLDIELENEELTPELLYFITPQIIGMLRLENFIPKEEEEIPLVDQEGKDEKDDGKEKEEKSSVESSDSEEEDPADSFL